MVWHTVSGDAALTQIEDEVAAPSQDERQQLLASGDFAMQLSAENTLVFPGTR